MSLQQNLFSTHAWRRGWVAGFIAFVVIAGLWQIRVIRRTEDLAQDILRKQLALPYQSPIEIVVLDDSSLHQAEKEFEIKFPWPREVYANAVDYLRKAGAKAIVFDFLFTSASSYGPDDDKAFAAAAKRHGKVIIGMQFTRADQPDARASFLKLAPKHQAPAYAGLDLDQARGVDAPKEPLWSAFAGVGDTTFEQDADGQGRRSRLAVRLGERVYPGLALSTALALGKAPELGADGRQLLLFRQPKGVHGSSRLYEVAASWPKAQAGEEPLVEEARFKDKIVFIGSSAPGLRDLRPSPMGKDLPGVELEAMALDNLLSGQSLKTLDVDGYYWTFLLLLCLFIANLSFRFRGPAVLLPLGLVLGANAAAAVWAYQHQALLLPLALPSLAAILAFSHTAVENYVAEHQGSQKLTGIFGQFLSPAVLAALRMKGGSLQMGGETRELTVFFSDLQGFTSFSEKLDPHALVEILNEYLGEMTELLVGTYDATVDKYIGDAIMAFWNAPVDQPDHAWRACAAAWACQRRLAEIQDALKAKGLDAGEEGLVMRIGLNTGPAVAGLMGSKRKLNYTVMGDTVNTASRLEGANKPYGSRILISEATKRAAGAKVLTRPLDYIKVKGKAEATPVFEVIGLAGEPGQLYNEAHLAHWAEALKKYKEGRFAEAKAAFVAARNEERKDLACLLFIERCDHYIHEAPPNWDGVYTMKTK